MVQDDEQQKLDDLAARIRKAEHKPQPETQDLKTGSLKAGRIGFDFMAAVLAGSLLGWLADKYLGTGPWGLIVMSTLGFVGGIMNVWKALGSPKQDEGTK